jgi:D-alanyl-D-alanine dipeptidase
MRCVRPVLSLAVAVGLVAVCDAAAAQASPDVPPVSDAARAAGFVDVRSVVPDAIIDLRYATTNNFTGTQLYPSDARCLVHQSMSQGLATAASALRPQGHLLVFWDCYRPHDVQVRMFNVVPNPAWVARPGPFAHSHESGRSVDVTFTSVQQRSGESGAVAGCDEIRRTERVLR